MPANNNSNTAPLILDGKHVRAERSKDLALRFSKLDKSCLAIVQVGDRADSASYIGAKQKFAAEIGVKTMHIQISDDIVQTALIEKIKELNADKSVHGIIVQLPLPIRIDPGVVLNAIDPAKDVDGLTSTNVDGWLEGKEGSILPATARGIGELLEFYKIPLFGKKVVVIGRSMLVGKPVAAMCLNANATVTVCHSKTEHLAEITREADILVTAAGKPRLIDRDYVREGQIVIDVGTSTDPLTGKLAGDVDFDAVSKVIGKTGAITPVPGGVGQMTVLALFENLYDARRRMI